MAKKSVLGYILVGWYGPLEMDENGIMWHGSFVTLFSTRHKARHAADRKETYAKSLNYKTDSGNPWSRGRIKPVVA